MAAPEEEEVGVIADGDGEFLQKFWLYETKSKYYLVGCNKSRRVWRLLKIDRTEPSELNIEEDPVIYSEMECQELLQRINEGNKPIGGLRLVTKFHGIVGIVKLFGPYYMMLITGRKKVGSICGHSVYAVLKTETYIIPNSEVLTNMSYHKDENRCKKLLCSVDLTKDFFFSYSYKIMLSLQKNVTERVTQQASYENMFVWNSFLTQGIRNHLNSYDWTVALVHGFFKQLKSSISGKDFWFTLIARRSRHFAGTRYLKRGVNEDGKVANDVETEQIVFEDKPDGIPPMMTSAVQHRGSIPLSWFQETSPLNVKPAIILKKDAEYKATKLHFDDLIMRYGIPIIILNLIKISEKKPRESLLRAEFAKAIHHLNFGLPKEKRLMFIHFDLNKYSRRKGTNVLALLGEVADNALDRTGFFHCQVKSEIITEDAVRKVVGGDGLSESEIRVDGSSVEIADQEENTFDLDSYWKTISHFHSMGDQNDKAAMLEPLSLQTGVLRTNCIDCLDRTNVAQFSYGLSALGRQLYALKLIGTDKIDLKAPMADIIMDMYERMGDTLAIQYGGSAAHNKIFSERRGQWKAATHSQEFVRTLQRYYNNVYMDAEKQNAINVFLGHFKTRNGEPALHKPDAGPLMHRQRAMSEEISTQFIKRCLSDCNILGPISTIGGIMQLSNNTIGRNIIPDPDLLSAMQNPENMSEPCDSAPEILVPDNSTPSSAHVLKSTITINQKGWQQRNSDDTPLEWQPSNFLDLDWLSSSENSFEESFERSSLGCLPTDDTISVESATALSDQGLHDEGAEETKPELSRSSSNRSDAHGYSDRFAQWVADGQMLCY